QAWIVFAILTCAHFYATYVFLQSVDEAQAEGHAVAMTVWHKLTTSSLLFFHGLVARVSCNPNPFGSIPRYVCAMSPRDPTTLLAHVAALGLFVAVARWKGERWLVRLGTGVAAAALCVANWTLGAAWAINASLLSLGEKV